MSLIGTAPCEIHRSHQPIPLTAESHHLIPRAWQSLWRPDSATRVLWAPQTIELCPTGHRAVHEILVRLMKTYGSYDSRGLSPRLAPNLTEVMRYEAARKIISQTYGRRAEFPIALMAVDGWTNNGGSLDLLISNRQYGYGVADQLFLVP